MLKKISIIIFFVLSIACDNVTTFPSINNSRCETIDVQYWLYKDYNENGVTLQIDTVMDTEIISIAQNVQFNKHDFDEKLNHLNNSNRDSLEGLSFQLDSSEIKIISTNNYIGPNGPHLFYNLFIFSNRQTPNMIVYDTQIGLVMIYSAHYYRYLIMSQSRCGNYFEEINYSYYVNDLLDPDFIKINLDNL